MALCAARGEILRLVLRRGMTLAVAGAFKDVSKNGPIAGATFQEATDLVGDFRKGYVRLRSASRNGSGSDAENRRE